MVSNWSLLASALLVLKHVSAVPTERADTCACGYKDETGAIWREGFVANFTKDYKSAIAHFQPLDSDPVLHDETTYRMQYKSSNVYPGNYGLQLRTQAYTQTSNTGIIYTAEIDSNREDLFYGTFRMRATVPSVPGVCLGFFSYYEDANGENVQETDIEFLSSDPTYYNTIHYTNQPGLLPNGDVDPAAYHVVKVQKDLTAFHNHRWDWLPKASNFYVDGVKTTSLYKKIPKIGSTLIANVWSDGGKGWTQGPPKKDATATIYWINAYFNSTSLSATTFNQRCKAAGNPKPCAVHA